MKKQEHILLSGQKYDKVKKALEAKLKTGEDVLLTREEVQVWLDVSREELQGQELTGELKPIMCYRSNNSFIKEERFLKEGPRYIRIRNAVSKKLLTMKEPLLTREEAQLWYDVSKESLEYLEITGKIKPIVCYKRSNANPFE